MANMLTMETKVTYADVDRDERLLLPRVFKLLQEAAIRHADEFDAGTRAMATRGESWVLNRMAVALYRYPRYSEALRVETWSSGIRGFKGYRDFRVLDESANVVIAGSSLWLYVSMTTKSIVRVPREVAAIFPVRAGEVFCPELEALEFEPPDAGGWESRFALRFSDVDANDHVNNATYLDLVQSALARAGASPRPAVVRIKYAKGISAEAEAVTVRIAAVAERGLRRFGIEEGGVLCAVGEVGDVVM